MSSSVGKESIGKRFCSRLEKLSVGVVDLFIYGILFFSLVSFLVCLFVYCRNYADVFSVKEILWFIPGIALLIFIGKLATLLRTKSEILFVITMILIEIIIAFIMIISYETEPCSDYAAIWTAANEMASGTFTDGLNPSKYMYYYNWQLGISAFESIIVKLGGTFLTLKIVCAFFLITIQYLEYHLVKRKFGINVAAYAYVLATLFMPWCLSIPQFTNHHIGLVLLLIVFYLMDKKKIWSWFLAGVVLAAQNIMRPLGIIVILSAICMMIYWLIKERRAKAIVFPVLLICGYFLLTNIFNYTFIAAGYTDANVSDARIPYFKFQKGLYGYSEPYSDLSEYDFDYEEYNAAMKEELIETVSENPVGTIIFIANKMCRYLGLFDYQFEMTYNHDVDFYTQYPVKALYSISWMQYIGMVVLAIIGYSAYRKKQDVDVYQVFFIGNTLVYIFIEAFSSYRFESYPFLIMLAALGYSTIERDGLIKTLLPQKKFSASAK